MQYKRKKKKKETNKATLRENTEESWEYLGFAGLHLHLRRISETNAFPVLQKSEVAFPMFEVDKSSDVFARSRFPPSNFPSHCHAFLGKFIPCVLDSPALNSSKCHFVTMIW